MLFQVEFGNCLSANAKGRFRILKTFSFSSGGRLVFASSRVGCEKRYRETRNLLSRKKLSMFRNLFESSPAVCSQAS